MTDKQSAARADQFGGDPYRPFRPRRGTVMARVAAVAIVLLFLIVAFTMPRLEIAGTANIDRVLLTTFGTLSAAFVYRYALLRAVPDREGLTVRNLVRTERLSWAQIIRVGYSGGMPWAVLELTSTDEVSVMAIQRADGAFGRSEAARLAALIAHHGAVDQD